MDDWVLVLIVFVSLVAGLIALVVLFFILQRCCCPTTDADLELENRPPISPIYIIDSGCPPRHHHPLAAAALVHHHRRHRRMRIMRMGRF